MILNGLRTRKELAQELQISRSTLNRWIKKENLNLPSGRYLKPCECKQVLDLFGVADDL